MKPIRAARGTHQAGNREARGRPPLRLQTTTLWEYPSQHYDSWIDPKTGDLHKTTSAAKAAKNLAMQGDKAYVGATPSWVVWQVLQRYTRPGDTVLDPMCGSGTTLDVCADLGRTGVGFDLAPSRPDIRRADSRKIPLAAESVDFVFIDPPYSTHVDYSNDPACIGKLDALAEDGGKAYYQAMGRVLEEAMRVLRDRRYMALYVSDSFKKRKGDRPAFAPIGFELFAMMTRVLKPIDIVAVSRQNAKLERGNWHKAAAEENFFLRGFNYLLIVKKEK